MEQMGEEILVAGFYTDRSSYKKDDKITAHMRLYNFTSESIRLNFGSGQRYDLYLLQDDEEIWRWSDDKFSPWPLYLKSWNQEKACPMILIWNSSLIQGIHPVWGIGYNSEKDKAGGSIHYV